jgi:thymidylate synthase
MGYYEAHYKQLVRDILSAGVERETRTGKTLALFNQKIACYLYEGFPMLTGRKISFKTVLAEAQWFLSGSTNISDLKSEIWNQWADDKGFIHPGYAEIGKQWGWITALLIKDPFTRKACMNLDAWNKVCRDDNKWLEPCYHTLQFYIHNGMINLTVSSRSSDVAVGLPHDIPVLGWLLTKMAHDLTLIPGLLTFNMTDAHINIENIEPVKEYLSNPICQLPILYRAGDGWFLEHYTPFKAIKMTVKP